MKPRSILYLLICLLAIACQDDLDGDLAHGGGMTEGMATFRFELESATEIYTRADDASANAIENVMLMVFDEDEELTKSAYFDAADGEGSVRLYLSGTDKMVYAFCNLPKTTREALQEAIKADDDTPYKEEVLAKASLTISQADGAYMGNFVMSGQEDLRKENVTYFSESYEIKVYRLAAKFDFKIYFHPEETGDQFAITGLYLYNTPKGSFLLPNGYDAVDELNAGTDYVDGTDKEKYFNYSDNGTDAKDGYRVAYETLYDTSAGTGIIDQYYGATFYQFENRRGAVYDNYNSTDGSDGDNWTDPRPDDWTVEGGTGWNDLSSLRGVKGEAGSTFAGKDLFVEYRQINKRILAKYFDRSSSVNSGQYTDTHTGFPGASFLVIEGVYRKANGDASDVKYYVYLGKDNYADFNVKRNHNYIYQVMIYTMEKYDTRVYSEALGNLAVYYDNSTLDAHFNVTSALLYSQTDWTAYVENPDKTPWLEISTTPRYIPRMPGDAASPEQAQFRLSGNGGLNYIYIHTDEYVPDYASPSENPLISKESGIRTGKIIVESGQAREEIVVNQYAAQMVICRIKYDIHTTDAILDTFYVERVLEKKNMVWGFEKYWSFVTDDLIAAGQWDGLANTRRLYDVALNGDKWDVAAAYPDGIPSDIALGYAIQKNRDRNGNGKIDYNEIVWYLPAANEIQALSAHIYGSGVGDYYPDGTTVCVEWDQDNGNFHTSSPSVADPAGITPGRSYYVTLSTGKKAIGLRSRYYNVLCARRHDAWRGNQTGETGGNVDNDEDWSDEEEVIMPRNN